MKIEIYKGDDIARHLSAFGLPCTFNGYTVTPSAVVYRFKPSNVATYGETIARKAVDRFNIQNGLKGVFSACIDGFTIAIPRSVREYPTFSTVINGVNDGYNLPIGIDCTGVIRSIPLDDCPHLLIAGATGSGKTVFLHNLIAGICCRSTARLVLVDCKKIELTKWVKNSHLYAPIATECGEAIDLLNSLLDEMQRRYSAIKNGFSGGFEKIVVVIDELADLMLASKKAVETPLVRLAQMGRACGIHLIIATQRPTVNVVTGLLKANLPVRVCFSVASVTDSVVMLDHKGGEKLLGKGDGIIKLSDGEEIRFQSPNITDDDIKNLLADSQPPAFTQNKPLNGILSGVCGLFDRLCKTTLKAVGGLLLLVWYAIVGD